MSITTAYAADIVKAERNDDGALIVYGKATGPELDLDEQVCDPEWLRKAMPQWAEYGNIREMHQPIVAGVGLETAEDGDQWYVKSEVVDEGTALKIEKGALKGYSVGIKNPRVIKDATAPGGRIVGGSIVEISYVDRPCNPTATLVLGKVAGNVVTPAEAPEPEEAPIEPPAEKTLLTDEERTEALKFVKAVAPDGSIDETPDIDGAEHVLQLLAKLIQAEAAEMAVGQFGETCDIGLLMEAAHAMKCFLSREKAGQMNDQASDEYTSAYFAAEADLIKRKIPADKRKQLAKDGNALPDGSYPIENAEDLHNAYLLARSGHGDVAAAKKLIGKRSKELGVANPFAGKDAEPDVTKTPVTEEPQANGAVDDLVKSAVADATKSYEAAIEELRADFAKLKATPIPGGPVMTAPASARQDRQRSESAQQAAYFRKMAANVSEPDLRSYYLGRATAAENAAGLSS